MDYKLPGTDDWHLISVYITRTAARVDDAVPAGVTSQLHCILRCYNHPDDSIHQLTTAELGQLCMTEQASLQLPIYS